MFETSVIIYDITFRIITEGCHLHINHRDNLKSDLVCLLKVGKIFHIRNHYVLCCYKINKKSHSYFVDYFCLYTETCKLIILNRGLRRTYKLSFEVLCKFSCLHYPRERSVIV